MSSEGVIVGTVVGVTVGIVAAHLGNKIVRQVIEDLHQEELEETKRNSFQEGWAAASNNPKNIRKRFDELFTPTNGAKGTTTKASKET